MINLITSQHYIDDATVESKRAARDYDVLVSPAITVDGIAYHNIIDGNHSFQAAMIDGVDPVITIATVQDDDKVQMIIDGDVDGYLEAAWHDDNYIHADTRRPVWG